MGYRLPTDTDWVSCSFSCHQSRPTPSSEPGTDYGIGYGQPVYAVEAGMVSDLNHSPSGGGGRYVAIDMNDGRRTRSLHMSEVWVSVGQWVNRGDVVGLSGGSGYGDDWYYGPHVHQTLWDFHGYSFCSFGCTIDFEPHVGDNGGSDMDANQAWQLQALYNTQIVFDSNGSALYGYSAAVMNDIRGGVLPEIGAMRAGGILFPGAGYYAFSALANNQHAIAEQLNKVLAILDPGAEALVLEQLVHETPPEDEGDGE